MQPGPRLQDCHRSCARGSTAQAAGQQSQRHAMPCLAGSRLASMQHEAVSCCLALIGAHDPKGVWHTDTTKKPATPVTQCEVKESSTSRLPMSSVVKPCESSPLSCTVVEQLPRFQPMASLYIGLLGNPSASSQACPCLPSAHPFMVLCRPAHRYRLRPSWCLQHLPDDRSDENLIPGQNITPGPRPANWR